MHPTSEFLSACLDFDALLAKLKAARENHFGADPDALNWGHVGSMKHANELLAEAARFLNAT